jgi:hypothetical protein
MIKIKEAFLHLENEVKNKRIKYYGVCVNKINMRFIQELVNISKESIFIIKEVNINTHFKFIQIPMNFYDKNNLHIGDIKGLGLNCISNRPFTSTNNIRFNIGNLIIKFKVENIIRQTVILKLKK